MKCQALLLSVFFFVAVCSALPTKDLDLKIDASLDQLWEDFKVQFEKKYDESLEFVRRSIWESNLRFIQKHNAEYDMGLHTYTVGVNQFADLTNEEFKAKYLSSLLPSVDNTTRSVFQAPLNIAALPDTVDWRTKGYVTPVKDQGQCGSCWAFSTTGSMEGQYFRKTSNLISFSEKQLMDCSRPYGNQGCNGGLMDNAFRYIKRYGIERESTYPYVPRDGQCRYQASKVVTKLSSFVDVQSKSESDLKTAVATVGPISVGIDASHLSFQLYRRGVYNERRCSQVRLDHGVLAVGYGTDNGQDYWLVKNSWNTIWGMKGYIKMSRNRNNQCGIATAASYPQL